jgi:hypothetical protein
VFESTAVVYCCCNAAAPADVIVWSLLFSSRCDSSYCCCYTGRHTPPSAASRAHECCKEPFAADATTTTTNITTCAQYLYTGRLEQPIVHCVKCSFFMNECCRLPFSKLTVNEKLNIRNVLNFKISFSSRVEKQK